MQTCVSTQQGDPLSKASTLKHLLAKPHPALTTNNTTQYNRTDYSIKEHKDEHQQSAMTK